jgi:tetratricopeptide (TPR) repeat protein
MLLLSLAAVAPAGGPPADQPAPSEVRGKGAVAPHKQDMDWLIASLPKAAPAASMMQQASRQDRVAELRRRAAETYLKVLDKAETRTGDKAAEAVARAAEIYYTELAEVDKAMQVYAELIKHYRNTSSAEAAAAKIGQYYQSQGKFKEAVASYDDLVRDYPANAAVEQATFARGACYEKLHEWVKAINAYEEYTRKYPSGKWAADAREQVQWIRTYHQVGGNN